MGRQKFPLYLEKGQEFGDLTVIGIDQEYLKDKDQLLRADKYHYLCKCSCGRKYSVSRLNLLKKQTTRCIMCYRLDRYDFIPWGTKFGRLTVVGINGGSTRAKNGELKYPSKWKYICSCECGNTTTTDRASLLNGNTQSCGCLQVDMVYKTCKKYNKIETIGEISLLYFKGEKEYAILDTEDVELVKDMWWFQHEKGYAVHRALSYENHYSNTIRMNKLVMGAVQEQKVDHENGLRLDNRKSNLRICTQKQNSWNGTAHSDNQSGVLGVYKPSGKNKWVARIFVDGVAINLGDYSDLEEATKIRQEAELKYFGEFAPCLSKKDPNLTLDKIVEEYRLIESKKGEDTND